MTREELVAEGEKRKMKISISSAGKLRNSWFPYAVRRHHTPVKHFQSALVFRPGVIQTDFCFFMASCAFGTRKLTHIHLLFPFLLA